jgi:hypothetical protein
MASLLEGLGRGQPVTGFLEDRNRQKAALLDRQIKQTDLLTKQSQLKIELDKIEKENAPILVTPELFKSFLPNAGPKQSRHAFERWTTMGNIKIDEQGRAWTTQTDINEGLSRYTKFQEASVADRKITLTDLKDSAILAQEDANDMIAQIHQQLLQTKKPEELRTLREQLQSQEAKRQNAFRSEKMVDRMMGDIEKERTTRERSPFGTVDVSKFTPESVRLFQESITPETPEGDRSLLRVVEGTTASKKPPTISQKIDDRRQLYSSLFTTFMTEFKTGMMGGLEFQKKEEKGIFKRFQRDFELAKNKDLNRIRKGLEPTEYPKLIEKYFPNQEELVPADAPPEFEQYLLTIRKDPRNNSLTDRQIYDFWKSQQGE